MNHWFPYNKCRKIYDSCTSAVALAVCLAARSLPSLRDRFHRCVIEIVNPTNEQENGNSSGNGTEPLVVVVKISSVFVCVRAAISFL